MEVDLRSVLDVVTRQRNEALDGFSMALAKINEMQKEIAELKAVPTEAKE